MISRAAREDQEEGNGTNTGPIPRTGGGGSNGGASIKLRFLKVSTITRVSGYALLDVNRAMETAGLEPIFNPQSKLRSICSRIGSRLRLPRNLSRSANGPVFVACMGYAESTILPFACWTEIIPYCFDCWEPEYHVWKSFFLRHRVRLAFFSALQSAQYFANALPAMKSLWLPEATDPLEYRPERKLVDRDIDVLELGRKHDQFHSIITQAMVTNKRVHLFEKVKCQIVFADKASFTKGIGRSKISVCFPCSQTHVERSGCVETVTHRYFESMASKCILLGHCPSELLDLFGYNPVVEIETGREVEQIELILSNLNSFQNLVERNYQRLLDVGTWRSRATVVIESVEELGETICAEDHSPATTASLKN